MPRGGQRDYAGFDSLSLHAILSDVDTMFYGKYMHNGSVAQLVRALARHARGPEFVSRRNHDNPIKHGI